MSWRRRLSRSFMETVLLCLRRFIYRIIVLNSYIVNTALHSAVHSLCMIGIIMLRPCRMELFIILLMICLLRKKLTQEEIRREVIALQDMGHKRLALETGEDPVNNPFAYLKDSIISSWSINSVAVFDFTSYITAFHPFYLILYKYLGNPC